MKYIPVENDPHRYAVETDDGHPVGFVWFRFNGWEIIPHGARVQILERFTSRERAANAALKLVKQSSARAAATP